jgi:hypothetical protein
MVKFSFFSLISSLLFCGSIVAQTMVLATVEALYYLSPTPSPSQLYFCGFFLFGNFGD